MFKATFHPPHPEYGMIFTGKKILGISQISLAEVSCSCKQFLRRVKSCKWLCCESMPLRYKRRYCHRIISLLFPYFFSNTAKTNARLDNNSHNILDSHLLDKYERVKIRGICHGRTNSRTKHKPHPSQCFVCWGISS